MSPAPTSSSVSRWFSFISSPSHSQSLQEQGLLAEPPSFPMRSNPRGACGSPFSQLAGLGVELARGALDARVGEDEGQIRHVLVQRVH